MSENSISKFRTIKSKKRGFTLVEVLIAMLILAGAMVALSQSWSGSLFAFRKSQTLNAITSLLKKKVTELEIKYKTLSFTEIPETENGDFGKDYPDLKWLAETKDMDFPDLTQLLVTQDGGANEMLITIVKQMTEFFSKSIKELRVTVIWTSAGREVKYGVTTYLVNNTAAGNGLGPGGAPQPPGGTPQGGKGGTQ